MKVFSASWPLLGLLALPLGSGLQAAPARHHHRRPLWAAGDDAGGLLEEAAALRREADALQTELQAARPAGDARTLLDEAAALRQEADALQVEFLAAQPAVAAPPPAVESKDPFAGATIGVAGANGRLGSLVCRAILRASPTARVVALIRDVRMESSSRLSYEIGAEDIPLEFAPFFPPAADAKDDGPRRGGGVARDYARVQVRVADVTDAKSVAEALRDCGSVVFCASSFLSTSARRPAAGVGGGLRALGNDIGGMLFEFRAPTWYKTRDAEGKLADVDGVMHAAAAVRDRRTLEAVTADTAHARLAPFLLVSVVDAEAEHLAAKRDAEARLLQLLPASVVVRPGKLFDGQRTNPGTVVSRGAAAAEANRRGLDGGVWTQLSDEEGAPVGRFELADFIVAALSDSAAQGETLVVTAGPAAAKKK